MVSGFVFGQRPLGQGIQSARTFVLLDLGVQYRFGSLVQPRSDLRHLLGRQRSNGGGNSSTDLMEESLARMTFALSV
jgi:hypothetical protein